MVTSDQDSRVDAMRDVVIGQFRALLLARGIQQPTLAITLEKPDGITLVTSRA